MNFTEAKNLLDRSASRAGFSETDVLIGRDQRGKQVVGVRTKYQGKPFEYFLELSGNDTADSTVFRKLVEDFDAPLVVWEVRLASSSVGGATAPLSLN